MPSQKPETQDTKHPKEEQIQFFFVMFRAFGRTAQKHKETRKEFLFSWCCIALLNRKIKNSDPGCLIFVLRRFGPLPGRNARE